MSEVCADLDVSYPKLIKEFDKFDAPEGLQDKTLTDVAKPINLLIDATFFGREYGFLVFHNCQKVIYFKEVKTESIKDFREGVMALKAANYRILSVTIDGRRGYINNIKSFLERFPFKCAFIIKKAIVRRYITDKPRSQCGKDLKELMHLLCKSESHQEFIDQFYRLKDQYHYFLSQRNEFGHYKHSSLRSAFRSIDSNMLYLFTYADLKGLNIPPTNNHLEGMFGHLKYDIGIHRGLTKERKKKAVKFFLKNFGKKKVFSTTLF